MSILFCVLWAFCNNRLYRHHGSEFEKHKTAFEEGGGSDNAYVQEDVLPTHHGISEGPRTQGRRVSDSFDEARKEDVKTIEKV